MQKSLFTPTDLILNDDGSVYHLKMKPEELSSNIILVGDPDRVQLFAKEMDEIQHQNQKREFCWITGKINQTRITILSTGIGTPNIDIALNEINALLNINFKSRESYEMTKSAKIIRIGTCGSIQEEIKVGQVIASECCIGFDNLMWFYDFPKNQFEIDIESQLSKIIPYPIIPYCIQKQGKLMDSIPFEFHKGLTIVLPGFYGPQDRYLNVKGLFKGIIDRLAEFCYQDHRIFNLEMEGSAVYGMSKLFNFESLVIDLVLANRFTKEFKADYESELIGLFKNAIELF